MTHYDPRDWGQSEPPQEPGWFDYLLIVLLVLTAAALLGHCSTAESAPLHIPHSELHP